MLGKLAELKSLDLSSLAIGNLDFLTNLTKLEYLSLIENNIEDITVLASQKNLRYLSLDYNRIRDITVLQKLTKLEMLGLSNNRISAINALVDNPGLSGAEDEINLELNCLNTREGSPVRRDLEALKERGIKLSFIFQKPLCTFFK